VFNLPQYIYDVNYNASLVYPPYLRAKEDGDLQNWLLAVHYLSICAGAEYGNEDLTPVILKCQPKLGGFKFRTDDPFIVDFLVEGSEYPVIDDVQLQAFDTAPAFVTLILGLVFSFLSTVVLVSELFGWLQRSYVPQLGVCLLASTFVTISSALITNTIMRSNGSWMFFQIGGIPQSWTQAFLCLTWLATGFIFVTFLWRLVDVVAQKEKRRRLLITGQI
jgi:hypothetical protein